MKEPGNSAGQRSKFLKSGRAFLEILPRSHSGNITIRLKYLIIGARLGNIQVQSQAMLLSYRCRKNIETPFARGL